MAKVKTSHNRSVSNVVEQPKLSYISGGNVDWYIHFGKLGTSTKTEHIVIL